MLDQLNHFTSEHSYIDLKEKILKIMGQFLDYLTSVFVGSSAPVNNQKKNHVTFAENSFSQAFARGSQEQATRLETLRQSNKRTIFTYEFITIVAFLLHFSLVLWPKVQLDSFSILEPEGWQLVTLNLLPALVQVVAIYAMIAINQPLPEGTKLTSKNSGLELDQNEFVRSLKVVVSLVAIAQVAALYSDLLLWSVIIVLPIWCGQLTSRLAQSEFDRHAPSPKKNWLNAPKSPKVGTPNKRSTQKQQANANAKTDEPNAKATPRTRTKRAFKGLLNNATDKYHQFEQSVAQQISSLQNMGSPLRGNKMIAYNKDES